MTLLPASLAVTVIVDVLLPLLAVIELGDAMTVEFVEETPPGCTVKFVDVPGVRAPLEAVNVYGVPALSMKRFEKVAKPPEAATVVVPVSVPLEGFVPMD